MTLLKNIATRQDAQLHGPHIYDSTCHIPLRSPSSRENYWTMTEPLEQEGAERRMPELAAASLPGPNRGIVRSAAVRPSVPRPMRLPRRYEYSSRLSEGV